jgi:hypothetical protein
VIPDTTVVRASFDSISVLMPVVAAHGHHIHWASNTARVLGLCLFAWIVVCKKS